MSPVAQSQVAVKQPSINDNTVSSNDSGSDLSGFEDKRGSALSRMKIAQLAQNFADDINTAQLKAAAENFRNPTKSTIQRKGSSNLPDNIKSGVESLSGVPMDDVKVHYNSHKPAQLQAHAYAQGTDIHVASGQEKHLPHEAWHVVQQKQGRVKPTTQLKGKVAINDDAGLEREADVMGAKAIQTKSKAYKPSLVQRMVNAFSSNKTAQLVLEEGTRNPLLGEEEERRPITKDEQFSPLDDQTYNESDFNLAKYLAHLTVLDGVIKEWNDINFSQAITDKKQIDRLKRFNAVSAALNTTGIGLGIATAVTFTCVTGGAGGVAVLGFLTSWQLGVAASGAGLGLTAIKAVATSDKPSAKDSSKDVSKEVLANGTGNADTATATMGLAKDTGAKIAGELVLGTAAAGLGGIFGAFGLYDNIQTRKDLIAKQAEVINDLNNLIAWLGNNRSIISQMLPENNTLLKVESSDEKTATYSSAIKPVLIPQILTIDKNISDVKNLVAKMSKSLPAPPKEKDPKGTKI
jgi:hypothetical protein